MNRKLSQRNYALLLADVQRGTASGNLMSGYLPAEAWMTAMGYSHNLVGCYECDVIDMLSFGMISYRISVLSQSGLFLLLKNGVFIAGRVVDSDETLMRFLVEHNFPFQ